jgi:PDZ domain-containing secreted protein
MEKIYHANTNQKKSGTRDLADLLSMSLESYKEKGHLVIIQVSVLQHATILNMYAFLSTDRATT